MLEMVDISSLFPVVPLGIFLHACEDEMIYKSVNEKGAFDNVSLLSYVFFL